MFVRHFEVYLAAQLESTPTKIRRRKRIHRRRSHRKSPEPTYHKHCLHMAVHLHSINITFVRMCVCMCELCSGSAGTVLKVIVSIHRQAMKVTNWERQMGSMSAGLVYDKDRQLLCDFQSLAVTTLYVRADFKNGPKKAMMSERACLRKLFDCLAARPDQEQMEAFGSQ